MINIDFMLTPEKAWIPENRGENDSYSRAVKHNLGIDRMHRDDVIRHAIEYIHKNNPEISIENFREYFAEKFPFEVGVANEYEAETAVKITSDSEPED